MRGTAMCGRGVRTPPLVALCSPASFQLLRRNTRHVRLDVEDRRAVEHVHSMHVQLVALATQQLDDRERDRIRPQWRSRCEYAVQLRLSRRAAEELVTFGAVEDPDHEEMREAFDVRQSFLEFRKDLEHTVGLMLCSRPLRDLGGFLERRPYEADRSWCEECVHD